MLLWSVLIPSGPGTVMSVVSPLPGPVLARGQRVVMTFVMLCGAHVHSPRTGCPELSALHAATRLILVRQSSTQTRSPISRPSEAES